MFFFFWVTNFRQEQPSLLFLCVHMLCMLCCTHSSQFSLKNLTDVGKYGSATEPHNSWSFRGYWSQVSDSDLTSFLLLCVLNTQHPYGFFHRWDAGKALDRWGVSLASFPFGRQKTLWVTCIVRTKLCCGGFFLSLIQMFAFYIVSQ